MTADLRERLSEITEKPDINILRHVGAFLRTTLLGAMAGGGPYMVFTVPIGGRYLADTDLGLFVLISLYPVLIGAAITLVASLVFGLPLTILLRRSGEESVRLYTVLGLLLGSLIPLTLLLVDGWEPAFFLAPGGMIAGGLTGFIWGRWREHCQRQPSLTEPNNPYHEMIY